MYKIKEWFLRWLCDWCRILDGLIGVLSFELIYGQFSLRMAKKLARYRMKMWGWEDR